jgi:c-di-GMP-binding flagellar brake protein YcgR
MAQDKRTGKRFPVKLTVCAKSGADEAKQFGETRDVSHGGIYFYTEKQLSRGSEIEIIIRLPSQLSAAQTSVLCRCTVVRIEPSTEGAWEWAP